VVYVNDDSGMIWHAAVPGGVQRPDVILASPGLRAVIDPGKPSCAILGIIVDFVQPAAAADITAAFRRAMPPASFLSISFGISNDTSDLARRMTEVYTAGAVHVHSREQIASYFAGQEIVEPGLTEACNWRPPPAQTAAASRPADVLAGVARKLPEADRAWAQA
jgi:S-adenosyl methyltransferase